MERWWSAFERWPSEEQLLFSIVCVFVAIVFLGIVGRWVLHLVCCVVAWRHGWPAGEDNTFGEVDRRLDEMRRLLYTDPRRFVRDAYKSADPAAGIPMPNLLGLKIHHPDDDRSSS